MPTMGRKRRTTNAEDPTPNLHGKRRRHSIVAFEMVRLDRAATEPLHQQLYRQIRDELASGSFNNNSSRLPSSRSLAADFGVSRFTVNLALSRLHAEGYLQSKIGSGTFISEALPETFLSARTTRAAPPTERPSRLSNRVKDIPDHRAGKQFDFGIAGPPGVSFVPAVAALDEFPIEVWERLRAQVLTKRSASASVCVKPRRSRVAQGVGNLFVRLQRRALRSRSNYHHRWNAAGNDDQCDGTGKSR